jgi:hypothetical protein
MIEAGFAERITTRCNKEDDRAKALFALGGSKKLNKLDGFVGQGSMSDEL